MELGDVVNKVLEVYYKGEMSLAEAVEEECKKYREGLLQAVNQFEHTSEKKVADEDVLYDKLVETTTCPANGSTIEIFRGVCQSWSKILEKCFQGACSKYPVLHKAPVVTTELDSKKGLLMNSEKDSKIEVYADLDNGKVVVGDNEMILEGKTFGAKLREIRDKLAGVLGVNKICEIINKFSGEKKIAKKEDIIIGSSVWLKNSAYTLDNRLMMWGFVVAAYKKEDDSELIVIRDGVREGYVVDRSNILKVARLCRYYRSDTGQCKKGCIMEGVIPGNMCQFTEDEQFDCKCSKK